MGDRHVDYRIEAITLPVGDVDRAKAFYEQAVGTWTSTLCLRQKIVWCS
jgi:predicted enzyme related to lactoylglutathione lyase